MLEQERQSIAEQAFRSDDTHELFLKNKGRILEVENIIKIISEYSEEEEEDG